MTVNKRAVSRNTEYLILCSLTFKWKEKRLSDVFIAYSCYSYPHSPEGSGW